MPSGHLICPKGLGYSTLNKTAIDAYLQGEIDGTRQLFSVLPEILANWWFNAKVIEVTGSVTYDDTINPPFVDDVSYALVPYDMLLNAPPEDPVIKNDYENAHLAFGAFSGYIQPDLTPGPFQADVIPQCFILNDAFVAAFFKESDPSWTQSWDVTLETVTYNGVKVETSPSFVTTYSLTATITETYYPT